MAAELRDLRTKISPVCWCFLEAEKRATGDDISVIARAVLEDWASKRRHAHIEARALLAAEGEAGILSGGSMAQQGNHARGAWKAENT